jgi:hypothetical protein
VAALAEGRPRNHVITKPADWEAWGKAAGFEHLAASLRALAAGAAGVDGPTGCLDSSGLDAFWWTPLPLCQARVAYACPAVAEAPGEGLLAPALQQAVAEKQLGVTAAELTAAAAASASAAALTLGLAPSACLSAVSTIDWAAVAALALPPTVLADACTAIGIPPDSTQLGPALLQHGMVLSLETGRLCGVRAQAQQTENGAEADGVEALTSLTGADAVALGLPADVLASLPEAVCGVQLQEISSTGRGAALWLRPSRGEEKPKPPMAAAQGQPAAQGHVTKRRWHRILPAVTSEVSLFPLPASSWRLLNGLTALAWRLEGWVGAHELLHKLRDVG